LLTSIVVRQKLLNSGSSKFERLFKEGPPIFHKTMPLKEEVENLTDDLRKIFLPSTDEMSRLSYAKFKDNLGGDPSLDHIKSHFSEILTNLISIEKNMFDEFDLDIQSNWYQNVIGGKVSIEGYSELKHHIEKTRQSINLDEDEKDVVVSKILKKYTEVSNIMSFSMKQSAKSRAGHCFENCLKLLFTKLNLQFEYQQEIVEGEQFDFLFPSKRQVKEDPHRSILGESQTTLKDRFRLSLGKGDALKSGSKYIFTATGVKLMTKKDVSDITESKVKEIKDKNWNLVVLKEVKMKEKFKHLPLISFEEFVTEHYESKKLLWS
jgi:hypothetical protein